ncbi:excinuclease ABC subunit C [Halarchaeum rubridurum]|uniref:UvrABC system protein C n=1 Tax=Halarchaeum rubridurum TaxID=489911 RepID=A0A830FLR7_9EURY|nr:excinuclease ABC subunit C [Halarchaeum rubridurum]MBP1954358.1 excinuclease ABC subunit C [Halarchaeum rubridurum]GGM59424.1 excinuclease ABC subunit C [Halarchaeum rubridurum]
MDDEAVREAARSLPAEPGVYQFQRDDGTTLYVGKAVDLRARVRSYADPRSARIARMVERAETLDFAVTDTETQALLLEANLIKRHQPKYNVRLKDDKSYPLVQLTAHAYPRIEVTRDPDEGATAYGPYTDHGRVETVVKAIRETYGLRGCSDHKFEGRERPCLDHDIGLCTAPCTGEIDREAYAEDVAAAKRFFEGETGALADPIEREMERAAREQEFERAANLRDRLDAVRAFHGGGGEAVASRGGERHVDVLGVAVEGDTATVARLHSEGGQLVDRDQHTLTAPEGEERVADVLAAFVPQYYAERALPDALLLPEDPGDDDLRAWLDAEGVAVRVPGAGREAKLVDLALKNAHRRAGGRDELSALRDALGLDRRPARIEGVDVSHAQGKAVVGSDVTFVEGSAETGDYRRKKLEEENDDYANMYRLVTWRARRAVAGRDDRPDPDLLLVDGGRGQLDAALDALDDAGWEIPAVALAKREEVVITPEGTHDWDTDAPQLHVLQRVRDEAHRFAVQYHQSLRDSVDTALDDVDGVGPETRTRLLRRFGSVEGIRAASGAELRDVEGVGPALAERLDRRL